MKFNASLREQKAPSPTGRFEMNVITLLLFKFPTMNGDNDALLFY